MRRARSLPRYLPTPPAAAAALLDDDAAAALRLLAGAGVPGAAAALRDAVARGAPAPPRGGRGHALRTLSRALRAGRGLDGCGAAAALDARERWLLADALRPRLYARGDAVQPPPAGGLALVAAGRLLPLQVAPRGRGALPPPTAALTGGDALPAVPAGGAAVASDAARVCELPPRALAALLSLLHRAAALGGRGAGGAPPALAALLRRAPSPPPTAAEGLARLRTALAAARDRASFSRALRRDGACLRGLRLPPVTALRAGSGAGVWGGGAPPQTQTAATSEAPPPPPAEAPAPPPLHPDLEQALRDFEREPYVLLQGECHPLGSAARLDAFLRALRAAVAGALGGCGGGAPAAPPPPAFEGGPPPPAGSGGGGAAAAAVAAAVSADLLVACSRSVHGGDSFAAAHGLAARGCGGGGLLFLAADTGAQPPAEIILRGDSVALCCVNVYRVCADAGGEGGVAVWGLLRCTVREEAVYTLEEEVGGGGGGTGGGGGWLSAVRAKLGWGGGGDAGGVRVEGTRSLDIEWHETV